MPRSSRVRLLSRLLNKFPGTLDTALQVQTDNDDAVEQATADLCRQLPSLQHLCQASNDTMVNRLCYAFIFESEEVEQTLKYANQHFLSQCPKCLAVYSTARDGILDLCVETFDSDSVQALESAILAFDASRVSGYQDYQECLTMEVWTSLDESGHLLERVDMSALEEKTWELFGQIPEVILPRIMLRLIANDDTIYDIAVKLLNRIGKSFDSSKFASLGTSMCLAVSSAMLAWRDEILQWPYESFGSLFGAMSKIFSRTFFGPGPNNNGPHLAKFAQVTSQLVVMYLTSASGWTSEFCFSILEYVFHVVCDPAVFDSEEASKTCHNACSILSIIATVLSGRPVVSDPANCTLAISLYQCTYSLTQSVLKAGGGVQEELEPLSKLIKTLTSMSIVMPIPAVKVKTDWFEDHRQNRCSIPSLLPIDLSTCTLPLSHLRLHFHCSILSALQLECAKVGRGIRTSHCTLLLPETREATLACAIAAFTDTIDDRQSSSRRDAMFQAFRDITLWCLASYCDDLMLWQVALSAFTSVRARLQLPTKPELYKETDTVAYVSQCAWPKFDRLLLTVPLGHPLDKAEGFVQDVDPSESLMMFVDPSRCFQTVGVLRKVMPLLLLKAHHDEKLGEASTENLLINLTEFALLPHYYPKLLTFLKEHQEAEWTGVGPPYRQECQAQMEALLSYETLVTETTDLIHGSLAFLFRHLAERLKLWAVHTAEGGKAPTTLPIIECSLSRTPVSFAEISKVPKPTLLEMERVAIGSAYQNGQMASATFSLTLSQLGILAFPLATTAWPAEVKRELSFLFSILSSAAVAQFMSGPRCLNLSLSIHPQVGTAADPELLRALGALTIASAKMKDEQACTIQGIDICFDQHSQWLQLASIGCGSCDRLPTGAYVEQLFVPANFSRGPFWFLRGLLPTLELLVDEVTTGASVDDSLMSSLTAMHRSVWSLILQSLRCGPVTATYCGGAFDVNSLPPSPYEKFNEIFGCHDGYLCLFSLFEKYIEHAKKHLSSAAVPNAQPAYVSLAQVHLEHLRQASVWAEYLARWGRAGQWVAIKHLVTSNGVAQEKAEETWATQSDLGQAIRECCLAVATLFKLIKVSYPEDRCILPRELLTLALGKIVTGTAKPPPQKPVSSRSGSEIEVTDEETRPRKPPPKAPAPVIAPTKAKPRESLVSKLLPGGGKSKAVVKQNFDVALEMMQQWNQTSTGAVGKVKPMQIRPTTRSFEGPKTAILLEQPKAQEKPAQPQLKKMSQQQKEDAMQRAKLGVQIMLQQILEWDFSNLDKYELPELQHLPERLPLTFDSADAFREYFKPLVLEECRCAILQERIERKLESHVVVISKATVSSSWMLATAKSGKRKRQGDNPPPVDPSGISPERAIINAPYQELEMLPLRKHDLVMMVPINSILNTSNPYEGKSLADLNAPPREGYFVAVVEKTDSSEERFDPSDLSQCKLRFPRNLPAASQVGRLPASTVTLASAWLAFPIASLTTSVREFQSLFTACFSPVFDFILRPAKFGIKKPPRGKSASDVERQFMKKLEAKKPPENLALSQLASTCSLNSSQSLAVKQALVADFGVALLQGPPGTGKTKTLLAIIAAIFAINGARPAPEPTSYLSKKILICAPSNAAVDEIAARILKEGVPKPKPGGGSETIYPTCLRVGNPSRITREEVRAISLEERLSTENQTSKEKKIESMKDELNKISARLDTIEEEIKAHSLATEMSSDLIAGGHGCTRTNANAYADLQTERRNLLSQRKKLKESFAGDLKQSKSRARDGHLKNTDLFFATLSGSASDLLTPVEFEYVIVDEAAQAVELSGLIPLRHEVSRLILIGDPQQLPATVLSASAKKFNYERSLFQRLQLCGVELVMLGTQYRMRPEISAFPSLHFYSGRLANDKSVIARPPLPFHLEWKSLFGPFKFFDVPSVESRHALSQSLCNRDEANFIMQLLLLLTKYFVGRSDGGEANKPLKLEDIAVVTPYKQQVLEMQRLLRAQKHVFDLLSSQPLEVCTIDSFQGREKKVIIFSCVRSLSGGASWNSDDDWSGGGGGDKKANIGFVADIRRLNVAITRARDALWIVGNARTLCNHETWASLISHAKNGGSEKSVPNPPVLDNFSEIDKSVYMDVKKTSAQLRAGSVDGQFTGSGTQLSVAELTSFFGSLEQRYLKFREEIAASKATRKRPALEAMLDTDTRPEDKKPRLKARPPNKQPAPSAPQPAYTGNAVYGQHRNAAAPFGQHFGGGGQTSYNTGAPPYNTKPSFVPPQPSPAARPKPLYAAPPSNSSYGGGAFQQPAAYSQRPPYQATFGQAQQQQATFASSQQQQHAAYAPTQQQHAAYGSQQQHAGYAPQQQHAGYAQQQQHAAYAPQQQQQHAAYAPQQQQQHAAYAPQQQHAAYAPPQQQQQQQAAYAPPQQPAAYAPPQQAAYVPPQHQQQHQQQQQQQAAAYPSQQSQTGYAGAYSPPFRLPSQPYVPPSPWAANTFTTQPSSNWRPEPL